MALSQSDSESSMVVSAKSLTPVPFYNAWLTFNDLRYKGTFCDVVIKVQDIRFPVHRLVLCACSEYFRALFDGGWKSSEKQEIEIPGVSPEMMASIINFAYTGQVMVTPMNVEELLPAADQFLITYVKDKCCSFLQKQMTPTNCIGIKQYARSYACCRLIDTATSYILFNFEEVARKSEEFLFMTFDDLQSLIQDDRLNVRLEETVCEAVFRWIKHDKNARKCFVKGALKSVRMGLLDPEFFMAKVKANPLIMECMDDCRTVIKEAMKVVCDLHSHDAVDYMSTQDANLSTLLRPRLPNEILLAIGGWSGGSPTNAIEAYDPRAEAWLNVSTIETSEVIGGYRTIADVPCAYHGVAYVKGCVFVIGGFDGVNYFNTVRRLNIKTYEWTQEPSMQHKRCYISVAVIGRKIYALGGMNGDDRLSSGECYDPMQKSWNVLPDMNERRSDSSATSLNGKVYIAGGFNGQECLFTAEFYDPESSVWTRITPMRSRRSGVSIISFHGLVYAVGGFDGQNRLRHAEAYCPTTNTWRNIASMNKPRSNFGIEVIDDQLLVVGGYNGHQTSADVEAYDDATNDWYEIKEMHICRSALCCCVISSLSHETIKTYCMPRDVPALREAMDEATSTINESVLSERSGISLTTTEDEPIEDI